MTSQSLGVTVQHQNNRLDLGPMTQRCGSDVAVVVCKWATKLRQKSDEKLFTWNLYQTKSDVISFCFGVGEAGAPGVGGRKKVAQNGLKHILVVEIVKSDEIL